MRANVVVFGLVFGCGPSDAACELPAVLSDLAGEGAQNCGTVEVDGDSAPVDACAVAAFQAGRAFFTEYELQGIDSSVSGGLAGNGVQVWSLSRDSDPSGGSQIGASVVRTECLSPTVSVGGEGHDVIVCDVGVSCQVCGGDRADRCE